MMASDPDATMNLGAASSVDLLSNTASPSSLDRAPMGCLDLLHMPKETVSQPPVWLPGVAPSPTLTTAAPSPRFFAPGDPASLDPTPATPVAIGSVDPGSGTSVPSLNSVFHPLHDVEASAMAASASSSSLGNPSSMQQQCVCTRL
jgi:hypothetical protein